MPTYEYECKGCGHQFEVFQSIKDKPLKKCPECGKGVKRLIGTGAAVLFRGSGFYETDYKRSSRTRDPKADTPCGSECPKKDSCPAARKDSEK